MEPAKKSEVSLDKEILQNKQTVLVTKHLKIQRLEKVGQTCRGDIFIWVFSCFVLINPLKVSNSMFESYCIMRTEFT